jgi:predicted ATPase
MSVERHRDDRIDLVQLPGGSSTYARLGTLLHLRADEMRQARQVQEVGSLDGTGSQLVNVIATMPRRRREDLAARFIAFVPVFSDVDVRPQAAGTHRLVFEDRWSPGLWYEPGEVSDGTLFALALLALSYQSTPATVAAVEEPEHGLHPYLVGQLIDLMRTLSVRDVDPVQFILATQSSDLLEHLRPDEVRFLSRDEDGTVTIESAPTDTDRWRDAYDAHQRSLSSLWLSGAVGGVP